MGNEHIITNSNNLYPTSNHITTWSGHYSCLSSNVSNNYAIKKTIHFYSHKEALKFVEEFQEISKEVCDFFVINPVNVELLKENICTMSESVNVYHRPLLPSLADKMRRRQKAMQ